MHPFVHLHVHSQYSILDGMSKIPHLVDKAMQNGMYSIALTDHGNMFGIKELTDYAIKVNGKNSDKIKEQEAILGSADASDEAKTAASAEIEKLKGKFFKPIIGVEAYCARRSLYKKDNTVKSINPESGKEMVVDRSGWHLILLAKNKKGYQSLCKLISLSWTDGFYGRPRIDKENLEKYSEGLIVSSACLGGELPQLIIANKLDEAEKSILWFKKIFGDDYYIELQRHKTDKPNADYKVYERQEQVIPHLLELARKTNTKVIATNDVHFVEESHAEAHERLICLSTGKDLNDPTRMRYTKQEWLKSPDEMFSIFSDMPEVLENTLEIANKVETYSIESGPIMPMFDIPKEFGTEEEYHQKFSEKELFDEFTRNEKGEVVLSQEDAESKIKKLGGYQKLYRIKLEADYLSKLAWEGAKKRYGETLTEEQHERIVFELHIMKTMGFPGYFLIVQDYIRAAREELGVSVGPGRGSAAGSVVAYCLKITDIDPLKYDLLFERFLNPDRISLPDIDVDFDDDGRGAVLDWVTKKYGKEKVAHIITYGTMATKSSIKDVGRVQNVPLSEVNRLTACIPDKFGEKEIDPATNKTASVNIANCLRFVPELIDAMNGSDSNIIDMLTYAEELEDTVRQVGIHACGVIIGADDLTKFAPLCTVTDRATNEDVLVTQYDGHVIESVGLIKMDFLGLKTLSIIKDALRNIKLSHGTDIDIDSIPIDDKETYELYCKGHTIGTFQFESPGMQKYLRELHPSTFEDLIAMNALYRPGPMDYIPKFISRKLGREPVVYDIPCMEKYLKDTYGVTVYQEQVMLLSRQLADFTRGESDALRKAMGKKQKAVLDKLKPKFIEGGKKNGHDPKILEKIWADWEKFASYAFNKSHATCYSWVAYQTAWLKAHYMPEYMAAVLSRSVSNISDIAKFMDECKSQEISVLGPDVNESLDKFTVNKKGEIRFGMAGIKGVGSNAIQNIISERNKNGEYKDIYDFAQRVNLQACNKKSWEALAYAGAFDNLSEFHRSQFFAKTNDNDPTFIETLIRYGTLMQAEKNRVQQSLFGDLQEVAVQKPKPIPADEWASIIKLEFEKEVVGMYLTAHPLDDYKLEIDSFCTHDVSCEEIAKMPQLYKGRDVTIAGIVTESFSGISKKSGKPFASLTLTDYKGPLKLFFSGQDYVNFSKFCQNGFFLMIKGKIQARWRATEDAPEMLEFKVQNIELLSEVRKTKVKNLVVDLPLSSISKLFINEFNQLCTKHKGSINLKFNIFDEDTKISIDLFSRNKRIDLNDDFIQYLRSKEEIQFKIN